MSEVTDIVVPLLQKIQTQLSRLEADVAVVREDIHNVKVRVTSLEANGSVLNRRMDSFDFRLERIERRLDLVEV